MLLSGNVKKTYIKGKSLQIQRLLAQENLGVNQDFQREKVSWHFRYWFYFYFYSTFNMFF